MTTASHQTAVDYSQFGLVHYPSSCARCNRRGSRSLPDVPRVHCAQYRGALVEASGTRLRPEPLRCTGGLGHCLRLRPRKDCASLWDISHGDIHGNTGGPLRGTYPGPSLSWGPWRLLHVGQLIRTKRVDLLLRAVRELSRAHDLRLDLIYQTRSEEQHLRTLAAELAIADRVQFRDLVSPGRYCQ